MSSKRMRQNLRLIEDTHTAPPQRNHQWQVPWSGQARRHAPLPCPKERLQAHRVSRGWLQPQVCILCRSCYALLKLSYKRELCIIEMRILPTRPAKSLQIKVLSLHPHQRLPWQKQAGQGQILLLPHLWTQGNLKDSPEGAQKLFSQRIEWRTATMWSLW